MSAIREIVSVLITRTVSPFLHMSGRSIPNVHRHRIWRSALHLSTGSVQGRIGGVGLWREGKIDRDLRQRLISFGNSQKMDALLRRHGLFQGSRIGHPNIFDGHPHQSPRQIQAIFTRLQHPGQPVQAACTSLDRTDL